LVFPVLPVADLSNFFQKPDFSGPNTGKTFYGLFQQSCGSLFSWVHPRFRRKPLFKNENLLVEQGFAGQAPEGELTGPTRPAASIKGPQARGLFFRIHFPIIACRNFFFGAAVFWQGGGPWGFGQTPVFSWPDYQKNRVGSIFVLWGMWTGQGHTRFSFFFQKKGESTVSHFGAFPHLFPPSLLCRVERSVQDPAKVQRPGA